jgi:hypothetical protein
MLFLYPSVANSREATIFYDHAPPGSTRDGGRFEYLLPGDPTDGRRNGRPARIQIEEGGEICFKIEHANAVLYDYSLKTEVLETPSPPSSLLELVKKFADFFEPIAVPKVVTDSTRYVESVTGLYKNLSEMRQKTLQSDSIADFNVSYKAVDSLNTLAKENNSAADSLWVILERGGVKPNGFLAMLRGVQTTLWQETSTLWDRFEKAKGWDARRCVEIGTDRLRISLRIKGEAEDNTLMRPRGDVGSVEAIPIATSGFAVAGGAVVSVLVRDQKRFTLRDGVVTEMDDDEPRLRPMVFGLGRAWTVPWLWGAIGVSADDDGVSDVFLGLMARFGSALGGQQLSIGIGPTFTRVAVGLEKGQVGEPLPEDIDDLDDIIERQLRFGLGFTLAITGFDFSGDKSEGGNK